jgi:hypothetical protein
MVSAMAGKMMPLSLLPVGSLWKEKEIDQEQTTTAGPLLTNLLAAHRTARRVTTYPALSSHASSLAALCEDLGSPLVWPVGEAAERLAGAAVLASEGEVRLRGWTDDVRGERVLLTTIAAVSPLGLIEAAKHARSMGAIEVHACGIEVAGMEGASQPFDSYSTLTTKQTSALLVPA